MIKSSKNTWILLWFMPVAIILTLFFLFPLLDAVRLSFTDAKLSAADYSYGVKSYVRVFTDPDLKTIVFNTVIFIVFTVVFQLVLGLSVGLLLETRLPGMGILKVAMIAAWVVPGVIVGILWNLLFSTAAWGAVNNTIKLFGGKPVSFMVKPAWALAAAVLVNVWRGTGFCGIMQYGALRAIDPQLYEAAAIDGAAGMKRFFLITLPLLKPMLMINIILITISATNTYDAIWSLTKGGPGIATTVLSLQTYKVTIERASLGQGAVYSVLMIVMSVILTSVYLRLMKGQNDA